MPDARAFAMRRGTPSSPDGCHPSNGSILGGQPGDDSSCAVRDAPLRPVQLMVRVECTQDPTAESRAFPRRPRGIRPPAVDPSQPPFEVGRHRSEVHGRAVDHEAAHLGRAVGGDEAGRRPKKRSAPLGAPAAHRGCDTCLRVGPRRCLDIEIADGIQRERQSNAPQLMAFPLLPVYTCSGSVVQWLG
jgi:hypothetical protein